jgi:hypothetical protein
MNRRHVFAAAAGGALSTAYAQPAARNGFFELRYYRMRNSRSNMVRRTTDFIAKGYVPAARRAGIGPVGVFSAVFAPDQPFLLVLSGYPSLAGMQTSLEKMGADAEYQKVWTEYNASTDLNYIRSESTLFRCFDSVPQIEPGPAAEGRGARTFELRTYESDNEATLKRKIDMFNQAEVGVFRRSGINPVFFGEALVGPNMPRLTYMVAYENMAARDKAWQAFGGDPEWQKIRTRPGWTDAEAVSNISNAILRPAAGSEIR